MATHTSYSHNGEAGENVEEIEVNPGDVILVGRQIGALRYAGPLFDPVTGDPSVDQFIGIELTEPTGGTDGSFGSRQYFMTEPGHGLFVPSSSIDRVLTAWELLKKVKEQHAVVTQILYQLNQCMAQLQQSNERKLYLENELRRYQQQLEQSQHTTPQSSRDTPRDGSSNLQTPNVTQGGVTTPAFATTQVHLPTPSADEPDVDLQKTAMTLVVPQRTPPPNPSPRASISAASVASEGSAYAAPPRHRAKIPESKDRHNVHHENRHHHHQSTHSSGRQSRERTPSSGFYANMNGHGPGNRGAPQITRFPSTDPEPPTPVRQDPFSDSQQTFYSEESHSTFSPASRHQGPHQQPSQQSVLFPSDPNMYSDMPSQFHSSGPSFSQSYSQSQSQSAQSNGYPTSMNGPYGGGMHSQRGGGGTEQGSGSSQYHQQPRPPPQPVQQAPQTPYNQYQQSPYPYGPPGGGGGNGGGGGAGGAVPGQQPYHRAAPTPPPGSAPQSSVHPSDLNPSHSHPSAFQSFQPGKSSSPSNDRRAHRPGRKRHQQQPPSFPVGMRDSGGMYNNVHHHQNVAPTRHSQGSYGYGGMGPGPGPSPQSHSQSPYGGPPHGMGMQQAPPMAGGPPPGYQGGQQYAPSPGGARGRANGRDPRERKMQMRDVYPSKPKHPAQYPPDRALILTVPVDFLWQDVFQPNKPAAFEEHVAGDVRSKVIRACFHSTAEAMQGLRQAQSMNVDAYLESEGKKQPQRPLQRVRTTESEFNISAPTNIRGPMNGFDRPESEVSVSIPESGLDSQSDDPGGLTNVIWGTVESPASSIYTDE